MLLSCKYVIEMANSDRTPEYSHISDVSPEPQHLEPKNWTGGSRLQAPGSRFQVPGPGSRLLICK